MARFTPVNGGLVPKGMVRQASGSQHFDFQLRGIDTIRSKPSPPLSEHSLLSFRGPVKVEAHLFTDFNQAFIASDLGGKYFGAPFLWLFQ